MAAKYRNSIKQILHTLAFDNYKGIDDLARKVGEAVTATKAKRKAQAARKYKEELAAADDAEAAREAEEK